MRKNSLKLCSSLSALLLKESNDFLPNKIDQNSTGDNLQLNIEPFLFTKSSSKIETLSGHCADPIESISNPRDNLNYPAMMMTTNYESDEFETFSQVDDVLCNEILMLNHDPNPEIIYRQSSQPIEYDQDIQIRYLKPPTPPPPG